MTADTIIDWLVRSPAAQRDKLATLEERYVAVIRELYDDDLQRVVREIKKRINSKKLAPQVAAMLADIHRDRAAKPRSGAPGNGDGATRSDDARVDDGGPSIATGDMRTQLEAAIAADPDAQAPYLPYADWLEARGDPFGPLVAMDRELAKNPGHKAMITARREHMASHRRALLGSLVDCDDILLDITWQMGFIARCRIASSRLRGSARPDVPFVDVLRWLLDEPGPGRFLQYLDLGSEPPRRTPAIAALVARSRPSLRELTLPLEAADADALAALAKALPNLATLRMTLGPLDRSRAHALANASWPALVALVAENVGEDPDEAAQPAELAVLFDGRLPKLRRVALTGIHGGDELCERIVESACYGQLEELELSRGTIGERGARALLAKRERLAAVTLNLDENYIPSDLATALHAAGTAISCEHQRDDGGNPAHRFVQVYE